MQFSRSSIKRFAALGITAGVMVLGYSAVTSAMVFGQPAADHAADAAAVDPIVVGTPAAGAAPVDEAMVLAGLQIYKDSGCRGCHGWAANGEREGPNPQGPSLRATSLEYDQIRETIACGRPGAEMPYFGRESYRNGSTDCYGVTLAQLAAMAPVRAATRLDPEELDAVAYYIANYVKGQGEITFEECEFFYGAGNTRCPTYPHAVAAQ